MKVLASEVNILVECVKSEGIYLFIDPDSAGLGLYCCNDEPRADVMKLIRQNQKLLINYLEKTGYHDA